MLTATRNLKVVNHTKEKLTEQENQSVGDKEKVIRDNNKY